jgi:hypothetical protein
MSYPPSSMPPPPPEPAGTALPENADVELEIDGPAQQRRLTAFFRVLLAIPQFVVLFFLGIGYGVALFLGWFGALAMGRLPEWSRRYMTNVLRYSTRVNAYLYLLVDRYPPFSFEDADHPVRLDLHTGRLNRAAVLFRIILIIPAAIINEVVVTGYMTCAFFIWLAVLITGRTPTPVFGAVSAMLRYSTRYSAYLSMLTSAYPKPRDLFGEQRIDARTQPLPHGTRPLALTRGAVALLIAFIVLGVLGMGGQSAVQSNQQQHQHSASASLTP